MACCAGSTTPYANRVGDDTQYLYTLNFEVDATAAPDSTISFKNCGCIEMFNTAVKMLAKFEPELVWRNVATNSLYTYDKLAVALEPYGVKEFNAGIVEDWVEPVMSDEAHDQLLIGQYPPIEVKFTESEIIALLDGNEVEIDGVIYKGDIS